MWGTSAEAQRTRLRKRKRRSKITLTRLVRQTKMSLPMAQGQMPFAVLPHRATLLLQRHRPEIQPLRRTTSSSLLRWSPRSSRPKGHMKYLLLLLLAGCAVQQVEGPCKVEVKMESTVTCEPGGSATSVLSVP